MRFLMLLLLLSFSAQDTVTFEWTQAGLTLSYPANWETPAATEIDGNPSLQLAEVLADTPIDVRPPGIPTLILSVVPAEGQDPLDLLGSRLNSIGIDQLDPPLEVQFMGDIAPGLTGTNADGQLFGIAQAAPLSADQTLVMVGRSSTDQRAEFGDLFDTVAGSIQISGGEGPASGNQNAPAYGILWYTQRDVNDAENAFLNLIGLDLGPGQQLYTYEADLGVVQIDAHSGRVQAITPNPNISFPSDLAVGSDGSVYVADLSCACIFTLTADDVWLDLPFGEGVEMDAGTGLMTGFGIESPAHLATGPDGTLYATNVESDGSISIRVFEGGVLSREIPLSADYQEQPLLSTTPDGRIVLMNPFGQLAEVGPDGIISLADLGPMVESLNDFALTPDDSVVVAGLHEGIFLLAPNGDFLTQVGTIVEALPGAGQVVAPSAVVVDQDNMLYFVDSDGFFGAISAMSPGIPQDRLGAEALVPDQIVQGLLSADSPSQSWSYTADAGTEITLTALDNSGVALDVALRVLAPDGSEIAYNDNHESQDIANPADAQIAALSLPTDGDYSIVVEAVDGEGSYSLGLTETATLNLSEGQPVELSGELNPVLPVHSWQLNGSAGQNLTITLAPTSGTLDPLLRLYGPDGSLIAENDDTENIGFGLGAELHVTLPDDGSYRLEAARFDGAGNYDLAIG